MTTLADSLASLPGYTLEVIWSFEGTLADGSPSSWRLTSIDKVSAMPVGNSLEMSVEGSIGGSTEFPGLGAMTIVHLDDIGYLYIPDIGCITSAGERLMTTESRQGNPDTLLGGLTGAELISTKEVVNGITNRLYRFDESALPALRDRPLTAEGEVLVAQPEGYISHISVVIEGQGDFLSRGVIENGSLHLEINVRNVGPTQVIVPPAACLTAAPYPVIGDAFQLTSLSDLVSYKSNRSLADVIAFYQDAMPKAGWSVLEEVTEYEDVAFLTYVRDGVVITINIDLLENQQGVEVFISP